MNNTAIVQKLWGLCHVLRDDGITYHQYVTELTYLLFLKMAQETETEGALPDGWRWGDLVAHRDNVKRLAYYRTLLLNLGQESFQDNGTTRRVPTRVQHIYMNAATALRQPRNLAKLVTDIDGLDWYSAREEGLGHLYEGLLEKNANEKKSGAGQYFTPRVLIQCMVDLLKPQAGEIIQDPACGTGGFLIIADRYIKERTDELFELNEQLQLFQKREAFHGVELVQDAHRLCLMNMLLHDIDSDVVLGDSLSPLGASMDKADVILTNPPFGTKKGGGRPTRTDFTYTTSNKQLAFLQHVYRGLKKGGRAAVVLPDNVLFEAGVGQQIRADLMNKCDLHTILRLPTGIFYAQGVKTNVLFFTRGHGEKDNTEAVWVYDMRTNVPPFGKRTPLTAAHFTDFMAAYGDNPLGGAARTDQGDEGLWRRFSREDIAKRGDNLDIIWLRDDSIERAEDLPEPEHVAAEIRAHLIVALEEIDALTEILNGENNGMAEVSA